MEIVLFLLLTLYFVPNLCIGFAQVFLLLCVSFLPDALFVAHGLGWLAHIRYLLAFELPYVRAPFPIGMYPITIFVGYNMMALMVGMMGVVSMPPLWYADISPDYIIGGLIAVVCYRRLFWPQRNR